MRYGSDKFLSIREEDVRNAKGYPIHYMKDGVECCGFITNPKLTPPNDFKLRTGEKEYFVGIEVDNKVILYFNDSTIEYIEFPVINKSL